MISIQDFEDYVFQQYVIDHDCQSESKHLSYFHQHQIALDVADRTTLSERLGNPGKNGGDMDAVRTYQKFILPRLMSVGPLHGSKHA